MIPTRSKAPNGRTRMAIVRLMKRECVGRLPNDTPRENRELAARVARSWEDEAAAGAG